ncbi:DnaB-like helicase N-terminal domain-containing protein [Streptomyces caniscabiei]|uniref:DnaB-like helicase N-terminal domain-containing protein n=1 Tax=Streptomyces caniscabiei TaxID=2746961 RepID=UPI0029ADF946|nr:DnaB-like helicase N-terminal domain-containing protein [Streptomyces caniscabiei]MDX2601675.1 DnaB-like helicase N-terminal domain-containing protein [Streptomyces caniscabiei]MDX2737110.1 DnaB-like helicase N-terminal domain-containing protein [Streptomyces caniscabiei]MDX2777843.1 DnaB-like helicase N-terminal domain-containing protein [Streptomyces caniscabiei]
MAQWLRPKLPEGPLRTFNRELHTLHGKAGYPSARKLSLALGKVVSHTNIHHAFVKPALPSWGVVEVVVEQLAHQARPRLVAEAEINRFKALWDRAHAAVSVPAPVASGAKPPPRAEPKSAADSAPSTFLPGALINRHRLIYEAIVDLHQADKPVGVPQVAAELERRGQLEFCGGEDYLFECVKVAMKGAYEAGMSIPSFAALSARKVQAAAKAREELLIAVFEHGSDPERARKVFERASELHPHWTRQPGEEGTPA